MTQLLTPRHGAAPALDEPDCVGASVPARAQRTREWAIAASLRWMSLGLPFVWLVLLSQIWIDGAPPRIVFGMMAVSAPLPALYWARHRLGDLLTTKLALLSLSLVVLYVASVGGFTPGVALLTNTLILLMGLLHGHRAFPWAVLLGVVILALGWLLYTSGWADPGSFELNDPDRPFVWVRGGLVLAFLGGLLRDISRNLLLLEKEKLLNELGAILASSLDADHTLKEVSRSMLRSFADLFVIELQNGEAKRLLVTARDPTRAPLAEALRAFGLARGVHPLEDEVWHTRRPRLIQVARDSLERHAQGAEHLALLRALDPRSIASAPVIRHGQMCGLLVAVSSERTYHEQDLETLVQMAARTAMALENAALHTSLQRANADIRAKLAELQVAKDRIRTLTGLLPVCAWCGRIRDDQQGGQWKRFEQYVAQYTHADVSHGICPDCASKYVRADPGAPGVS